jgi:hypothetical protein
MAVTVKHTKVILDGDEKPVLKSYQNTKKATKDLGDSITSQFKKIGTTIAATLGVATIGKFFKDSAKLAVSAQETFSKFGTVFENNLAAASAAALNLRDNFGLSELASKGLLASTGDLLVGLGAQESIALKLSERVQGLSADISSFQNLQGGAARASEIITKAMLGERDALISLGVKVSEADVKTRLLQLGQDKLTGQALLLARAQATLQLVTEQSGKAIGDYSRTSESAANQIRRLGNTFENFQINVGKSLIQNEAFRTAFQKIRDILEDPAIIEAISSIGTLLVNAFSIAIPIISTAIKVVAGITNTLVGLKDVLIPLGIALAGVFIAAKVQAFAAAFTILGGSVTFSNIQLAAHIGLSKAAAAASALLGKAMPLIALAAAAATLLKINALLEDLAKQTDKVIAAEVRHNTQMQKSTERFRDFRDFAKISSTQLQQMTKDFAHIEDRGIRFNKTMRAIRDGKYGPELAKQYGEWRKSGSELSKTFADVSGNIKKTTALTKDQIKAIKEAKKNYDKLAESLGILTEDKQKKLNQEIEDAIDILSKNQSAFTANSKAAKLLRDKIESLIKEFGGLDNAPPKLKALRDEFIDLLNAQLPVNTQAEKGIDFIGNLGNVAIASGGKFNLFAQQIKLTKTETEETKKETSDLSDTFTALSTTIKNAFDALSALGINLGKLPEILGAVSQGINSIGAGLGAIKTPGKSFVDILSKVSGGISIVTGAISALAPIIDSIFGKKRSSATMVAQDNLRGLTGLTQDWQKRLEELGEEMGGRWGPEKAFTKELGNIIRDTPATLSNFDAIIEKIRKVGGLFKDTRITFDEATAGYGDAFAALIPMAEELGLVGSSAFIGLIENAEMLGLSVQKIADFVESKNIKAFEGWKASVEAFGDASIGIFDEMTHKEEIMALIPDKVKAGIDGLTTALINMSDAQKLTGKEFDIFEDKTLTALAALKAQGIEGTDAIDPLKDLLSRLAFLQDEFGFSVDDSIQKLINEGKASGQVTGSVISDSQKQIDIQERMLDVLERIGKAFGVDIPGGMDEMSRAGERMANRMNDDLSRTQKNLSGIANTINTDVVNALNNMGDTSDEVMWEKSILPDIEEWRKRNAEIEKQLKGNMVAAIDAMGHGYTDVADQILSENDTLQSQLLGLEGDINRMVGGMGLQALAAGRQRGEFERFGVIGEERKQEMSIEFKKLAHLWQEERATILGSERGIANFLRAIEGLTVIDELEGQFDSFLSSMKQWNANVQAGKIWSEEKLQWLQHGTIGFQPIQTAIVGEAGIPELVQVRGNEMNVTPLADGKVSAPGAREININMRITPEQGLDVFTLAHNMKYVFANNPDGVVDEIVRSIDEL